MQISFHLETEHEIVLWVLMALFRLNIIKEICNQQINLENMHFNIARLYVNCEFCCNKMLRFNSFARLVLVIFFYCWPDHSLWFLLKLIDTKFPFFYKPYWQSQNLLNNKFHSTGKRFISRLMGGLNNCLRKW